MISLFAPTHPSKNAFTFCPNEGAFATFFWRFLSLYHKIAACQSANPSIPHFHFFTFIVIVFQGYDIKVLFCARIVSNTFKYARALQNELFEALIDDSCSKYADNKIGDRSIVGQNMRLSFTMLSMEQKIHDTNKYADKSCKDSPSKSYSPHEITFDIQISDKRKKYNCCSGICCMETKRLLKSFFKVFSDDQMRRCDSKKTDQSTELHQPVRDESL